MFNSSVLCWWAMLWLMLDVFATPQQETRCGPPSTSFSRAERPCPFGARAEGRQFTERNLHPRTPYGLTFEISGTRQWRQYSNAPIEHIGFNWHSSWGLITDPNKFRFEYNVEKNDAIIHGFAWGDITYENESHPFFQEISTKFLPQIPCSDT